MKTERMVLLVTPEEKTRIINESAKLGVSASEYIRKLVGLLDADDVLAAEELAVLAPELAAMADRLDATFADFNDKQKLREERWVYLASPEYREAVRREVLDDPTIDWPRMRALFGGSDDAVAAA
jgi:Arc/MetJ-type ribon-helix-helix transcriptional regulator